MVTRRHFTQALAASCLLPVVAPKPAAAAQARKRIAFIGTDIFLHSHAQHFLDRFHLGYTLHGLSLIHI